MAKRRNPRIGGAPDDMDFIIIRDANGKVIPTPAPPKKKKKSKQAKG